MQLLPTRQGVLGLFAPDVLPRDRSGGNRETRRERHPHGTIDRVSRGTKHHAIRADDELWVPFTEQAQRQGTNASAKFRAFMLAELAKDGIVPGQSPTDD